MGLSGRCRIWQAKEVFFGYLLSQANQIFQSRILSGFFCLVVSSFSLEPNPIRIFSLRMSSFFWFYMYAPRYAWCVCVCRCVCVRDSLQTLFDLSKFLIEKVEKKYFLLFLGKSFAVIRNSISFVPLFNTNQKKICF